ncbi:polysaccharide pyruvyl transferase family protein [Salinibacter sp.]|uniref:polysaccharide pyruvyl transferase family protein n=1 Tax=Salinibacter sp. TaxID=2065818 RepID=UPI0021E92A86|nr:polysaccharide pyruvyl transferase family protein [Salinibacter sp.]
MRLGYADVPNFGDALNPIIFEHFLPDFFDAESDEVLIGIGSILGFEQFAMASRKVVFSSGYAVGYADPPSIDETYDIHCVRGPLTARELGLDSDLSLTDGAALLRFMDFETVEKTHSYTYIPHKSTEKLYDWPKVCQENGINYVSPEAGVSTVLKEIRRSEVVLAEAMHAAIVADTFRIPWVPVVTNARINEFKWRDWTASLGVKYSPQRIPRIYQRSHIEDGIQHRLGEFLPRAVVQVAASGIDLWYRRTAQDSVYRAFEELKHVDPCLSEQKIFDKKSSYLREVIHEIEKTYEK